MNILNRHHQQRHAWDLFLLVTVAAFQQKTAQLRLLSPAPVRWPAVPYFLVLCGLTH